MSSAANSIGRSAGVGQDGRFMVTSGRWTDRSRWDHPDFVIPKPEALTRKSRNAQIDVDVVDAILGR